MSTNIDEKIIDIDNLSGAIQRKSTNFQVASGEVSLAINATFERIGGVEKIKGYEQLGVAITTTTSTSTSTSTTTSSTSTSTSTSSSTSSSTSTSSTTTG